jgi:hypothetical protein
MAAMVGKSMPEGGIGCGLAAGAQETSDVQVSVPDPFTVTQALLRQALWVCGAAGGAGTTVTVVVVGQTQLSAVIQLTLRQWPPAQVNPEEHSSLTVQLSLQAFGAGGQVQSACEEQAAFRHRPLMQANSFGQSAELVQAVLHVGVGGGGTGGQVQLASLTQEGLRHSPLEQTVPLGQSLLAAQSELHTGVGAAATVNRSVHASVVGRGPGTFSLGRSPGMGVTTSDA